MAAVSNVSLVSVASTIGVTQLGSLFVQGNQTSDLHPILAESARYRRAT